MSDVEHLGRRCEDVDITDIEYIRELEQHAQRAAEERIELAHVSLEEIPDELEGEISETLAGPYCGCTTCDVREILDAAWPYLQRLAASTCWCGGHRGPRDLPDADGWGCLEDIHHRGER